MRKWAVPACICLLLLAACTSEGSGEVRDERTSDGSQEPSEGSGLVYAAVGASETAGWGAGNFSTEAWPRVLLNLALPDFELVNLGLPGATVERAIERELPKLRRVDPDVVTVWLNANDILQGVSPARYKRDLTYLLRAIDRTDPQQVLVANTPPLHTLPAYRACRPDPPENGPFCFLGASLPPPAEMRALVGRYNRIIKKTVGLTGGTLVDLHSSARRAQELGRAGELISGDGLHPSTTGHRAVAESFSDRLEIP